MYTVHSLGKLLASLRTLRFPDFSSGRPTLEYMATFRMTVLGAAIAVLAVAGGALGRQLTEASMNQKVVSMQYAVLGGALNA